MSEFTAIDLSKLERPAVLEPVSYEDTLEELLAAFREVAPSSATDHLDLASDPIRKLFERVAFEKTVMLSRINQSALACMLAFASGSDLDHLAALVPLERRDGETDAEFRARVQLAPEGFSTAGSRGSYKFHVGNAHPDVRDVAVFGHVPTDASDDTVPRGHIHVVVFSEMDGTLSADARAAIEATLEATRPLNDNVSVLEPTIRPFSVTADLTIGSGPSPATVLEAARAALAAHLAERLELGTNINRALLIAALSVSGVENVDLSGPGADLQVGPRELAVASAIRIERAA